MQVLVKLATMLPRSVPRAPTGAEAACLARSLRLRGLASAAAPEPSNAPAGAPPRPRLVYTLFEAPAHRLEDHVERPERVQGIVRALNAAGFVGPSANPALAPLLQELPPTRRATLEEVALVHSYGADLKAKAAAATPAAPVAVADLGDPDGVTYLTRASWDAALTALGASLSLVDAVVDASRSPLTPTSKKGDPSGVPSAFGVLRPPGHHATPDTPLGYCLLNNVAVAARYAQTVHGIQKVMILDFDVHNGNGTCAAFWTDPSVLVIDSHEENTVYPIPEFVPSGAEDVGAEEGEGLTINIPLPRFAGHAAALAALREIVVPAASRFGPDIIMVSAGYDAHVTDPFQLLQFRSSTYHAVATTLRALADELCGGRLVFLLEGGYDADALGESVAETWRGLVGLPSACEARDAATPPPQPEPLDEVTELLHRLRAIHKLL